MSSPHCINTKSKWFKDLAKKLDIAESKLDDILHSYQSKYDTDDIPSEKDILDSLEGNNPEYSDATMEIWGARYMFPITLNSYKALKNAINEAGKYFPKQAITYFKNQKGEWILKVARPENPNATLSIENLSLERREGFDTELDTKAREFFKALYPEVDVNYTDKRIVELAKKTLEDFKQEYPNAVREASKMTLDEAKKILSKYNRKTANFQFQLSKKRKAEFEKRLLDKAFKGNLEDADFIIDEGELVPILPKECAALIKYMDTLKDSKQEDTVFRWYLNGTINIAEDDYKIRYALEIIENKKVNPKDFNSPMEVINKFPSDLIVANRNSIEVGKEFDVYRNSPYLSNETIEGEYVVYDVEDSEESAKWIAENIIAKYFDKSPWCIFMFDRNGGNFGGLGRGEQNILRPIGSGKNNATWTGDGYWNHYNHNKHRRIAINKNGIPAFMKASSYDNNEWWDAINDAPAPGPSSIKYEKTEDGRTKVIEVNNGIEKVKYIFKGSQADGQYIEYSSDGKTITKIQNKRGRKLHGEQWNSANPNTKEYYTLGRKDKSVTKVGAFNVITTYDNIERSDANHNWYEHTPNGVTIDKGNSSISEFDLINLSDKDALEIRNALQGRRLNINIEAINDVVENINNTIIAYYNYIESYGREQRLLQDATSLIYEALGILNTYDGTYDSLYEIAKDLTKSNKLNRSARIIFKRLTDTKGTAISESEILEGTKYKSIAQFLGHTKALLSSEASRLKKSYSSKLGFASNNIKLTKTEIAIALTIQELSKIEENPAQTLLDILNNKEDAINKLQAKRIEARKKELERQQRKEEEERKKAVERRKKLRIKNKAKRIARTLNISSKAATFLAELDEFGEYNNHIPDNYVDKVERAFNRHEITDSEYRTVLDTVQRKIELRDRSSNREDTPFNWDDETLEPFIAAPTPSSPFEDNTAVNEEITFSEVSSFIQRTNDLEILNNYRQHIEELNIAEERREILRNSLEVKIERLQSYEGDNYESLETLINSYNGITLTTTEINELYARIDIARQLNTIEFNQYLLLRNLLTQQHPETLPFQMGEDFEVLGISDLNAMSILIDAVRQKQDTLPHEYAHQYIGWYRHTQIVQDAIKAFGTEEKLVQAIGELTIKRNLKARKWWQKICDFILNMFNKDKRLLDELTDSFLTKKALSDYRTIGGNTQYQIVGEKGAKRADTHDRVSTRIRNLNIAKALSKIKTSPEKIKTLTNWELGKDGKWRYEESDIRLKEDKVNSLLEDRRKDDSLASKVFNLEDLVEYDATYFRLINMYPAIKNLNIRFDIKPKEQDPTYSTRGWYDSSKNELVLNPFNQIGETGDVAKEMASIIIHEIQHVIQNQEGFAKGGNRKLVKFHDSFIKETKVYNDRINEIGRKLSNYTVFDEFQFIHNQKALFDKYKDEIDSLKNDLNSVRNGLLFGYRLQRYNEIKRDLNHLENQIIDISASKDDLEKRSKLINDLHKELNDLVNYNQEDAIREINDRLTSIKNEIDKANPIKVLRDERKHLEEEVDNIAFKMYQSIYGEVEARNVQNRKDMSEQQRRNTTLASTETDDEGSMKGRPIIFAEDINHGGFTPSSRSEIMESSTGGTSTKGTLGVDKSQLIALLGSTMYKNDVQEVAIKELVQNAFDAVKIAKSQGQIKDAKIDVTIDSEKREIIVSDNGVGMTPEIVQKAFFTIGGSYKGDDVDNRLKSGGLGMAKMAFLFSAESIQLETVKDGILTTVTTNPNEIQNDNFFINTQPTNRPNGTTVKVKIPESYIDEKGEKKNIYFSRTSRFLSKPLIGDVDVNIHTNSFNVVKTTKKEKIPEGYKKLGTAKSAFGDLEIFISTDKNNVSRYSKVLSSGLYQFDSSFLDWNENPRVGIIVNVRPTVDVRNPIYPFNNNRESYRGTVEPEVKDLNFLLQRINKNIEALVYKNSFSSALSMDVADVAEVSTDKISDAEILEEVKKTIKAFEGESDKEDKESKSYDLKTVRTEREESEKNRTSSFRSGDISVGNTESSIDTINLDINKPVFHNNTTMVLDRKAQDFCKEIGTHLINLRTLIQSAIDKGVFDTNGWASEKDFSKQFWGISIDTNYGGVNVHPRIFNFLSINPFYSDVPKGNSVEAYTAYIEHLIFHEFNHNYVSGEGAQFTGHLPSIYSNMYGMGEAYFEWRNNLKQTIANNIEVIKENHEKYRNATNKSESFEGGFINDSEGSKNTSTQNDAKNSEITRNEGLLSETDGILRERAKEIQEQKERDSKERTLNNNLNESSQKTQQESIVGNTPKLNIPIREISKQFDIKSLDRSKVEITYHKEPWKDDSTKTKYSARIYLKGHKEKGYFEIVADTDFENTKFNQEYSVHFKTSTEKYSTPGVDQSTSKEREILYSQVRAIIPAGSKVSTWGELTMGGVYALEKLGKNWKRTEGESRNVKLKDGTPRKIPVFTKPSESKMTTMEAFLYRQSRIKAQMFNLFVSSKFTHIELGKIADNIVYEVSNILTEIQNNPEKVNTYFPNKGINVDSIRKVKDRVALVNLIEVSNIIEFAKNLYASTINSDGTPKYTNLKTAMKAKELAENWDAVMQLTVSRFNQIEGFSLIKDIATSNEKEETISSSNDEYNSNTDLDSIREMQGDLQEAWQVDSKTIDAIQFMSSQVKSKLDGMPILKITGFDENNNPITEVVKNEFGNTEFRTLRETTQTLLTWFQGTRNMSDMIAVLKEKQTKNPWVLNILPLLEDTSGEYSYFQNEFFSVMYRPFQNFDVVSTNNKGNLKVAIINKEKASDSVIKSVKAMFKIGEHPLFKNGVTNSSVSILQEGLNKLKEYRKATDKNEVMKLDELHNLIGSMYTILLGFRPNLAEIQQSISATTINDLIQPLEYIVASLKNNIGNTNYNPFLYNKKGDNSGYIQGNLKAFIKPLTDVMTETSISSFYDSGKMYQSYVIPSYMTNMMIRLKDKNDSNFKEYIDKEFSKYPWFKGKGSFEQGWRNSWLKELVLNPKAREVFDHKINLNMNKKNYMKNMNSLEYTISVISEFFSEGVDTKDTRCPSWYRVPILSNKPSSEYIRFYSERGANYKQVILNNMLNVFNQEVSRIQTVRRRDLNKSDADYIKTFDEKGKNFCFFDFLNAEIANKTDLGLLLERHLDGNEDTKLSTAETTILLSKVQEAIANNIEAKTNATIELWEKQGIDKYLIQHLEGFTKDNSRELLTKMLWNDTYAQIMIQELLITDPAYYKNADDIQKRIAQVHAPGIRPNIQARYPKKEGKLEADVVSDGVHRNVVLADFDKVKSSTLANIEEVFNRRIEQAPDNMKEQWRVLKKQVVKAFSEINVTDAQAYCSMTGYRKKSVMFGKWNNKAEDVYDKLLKGDYTFTDLQVAFQPLKPFMYSQTNENMHVENAPLSTHKRPYQNKNAEYLLILADALTRNEKFARPNLLKVINDVVEESHYDRDAQGNIIGIRKDGIDTIEFNSAVKCGERGAISLNEFTNIDTTNPDTDSVEKVETLAKNKLLSSIYSDLNTHSYNLSHVNKSNYEDYSIQQEVPEHFKNHSQAHGSQERFIVISDLADTNPDGTPAIYSFKEADGTEKNLTKNEFKQEYERTIAENIQEDIDKLVDDLKLRDATPSEKKAALSKVIQEEIDSSSRYGIDLWLASCIDETTDDFVIPLGDPIQSKRIEQLLNSVIKNRINKQKLPGGPVVQVSNFGMSRQLHTRYFNKNTGGILMTKEEFAEKFNLKNNIKTANNASDKFNARFGAARGNKESQNLDEAYAKYCKENQGGVAYHECFAPIPSEDFFDKFADENGNIDIKAIEATNPELLYMISNRIPTEAKYSIETLKIVGFLPREAGEAVVLPFDITSKDGSDYDVDKRYLQHKKLPIKKRATKEIKRLILAEVNKPEIKSQLIELLGDDAMSLVNSYLNNKIDGLFNTPTEVFIRDNKGKTDNVSKAKVLLHSIYRRNAYITITPTSGRDYRNNKIIDMTRCVMQHESQAAESLTPQSFETEKTTGYAIEAFRRGLGKWDELISMDSGHLKELIDSGHNLLYCITQIQYYKQNSDASSLLGMFAIQKIAHAALEGDGIRIDTDALFEHSKTLSRGIYIGNSAINSETVFDESTNREGEVIGTILGSHVGAAADAAKDPFLSLMNINMSTVNVFSTMLRAGIPYRECALFMSSSVISEMSERADIGNLGGTTSLFLEMKKELDSLVKEVGGSIGELSNEPLTEEEMLEAIKTDYNNLSINIKIKTLNYYLGLSSISTELNGPTFATRFNSISNAVGPLIIDNLMTEYKISQFPKTIMNRDGETIDFYDLIGMHPILEGFHKTLGLARDMFGNMPANSSTFRSILGFMENNKELKGLADIIETDREIINKFSNFFQSYLLISSGAINENDLAYYVNDFPADFVKGNYTEVYPDNKFIENTKLRTNNDGTTYLNVETTGLQQSDKDMLINSWVDLYNAEKAKGIEDKDNLAIKLFNYYFFRRGIGFSPETAMGLLPLQLKLAINKYVETFRNIPFVEKNLLIDSFVRNNAFNDKLVPFKGEKALNGLKLEKTKNGKVILYTADKEVSSKFSKLTYFKFKHDGKVLLMRRRRTNVGVEFIQIEALGNEGEYLEMSTSLIETPLSSKAFEDTKPSDEVQEVKEAIEPQNDESSVQVEEQLSEGRRKRLESLFPNAQDPSKAPIIWRDAIKNSKDAEKERILNKLKQVLSRNLPKIGESATIENINKTIEEIKIC